MENTLMSYVVFCFITNTSSGVQVQVSIREQAAGDIQADRMAFFQFHGNIPNINTILINLSGRKKLRFFTVAVTGADQFHSNAVCASVGVNIAYLADKVSVHRARGRKKLHCDRTRNLDILLKRLCGVYQNILPAFVGTLVLDKEVIRVACAAVAGI